MDTGPKAVKELQAEVAKAQADELSGEASLRMRQARGTWPF